ncbi:MAG: ZIP family metal transporter [Anaerolineales bacterium]|nr:ZIP family metal transporter [Anaerolineales bacterium]
MAEKTITPARAAGLPGWLWVLLPALALLALVAVIFFANPAAVFTSDAPPPEALALERIVVVPEGFRITVLNSGARANAIAQVMVDDAFWGFSAEPSARLPRLGRATLTIDYPWVRGEPHTIRIVTPTGATFEGQVLAATLTPQPGLRAIGAYALLGLYVGVIPVVLGVLWFPAMRRLGRRGLGAVLALTLGLLIFLLVDTLLEAFELAAELPGVFQGVPLALFAALLTWLALLAVGNRRGLGQADPVRQRLYLAGLIALGIGLHNFGEGLAIGAAFALGEAALGSFLVFGFTLHNVTEGIGIAAPLTRDQPGWRQLGALALLAGAPAILGAWIGGFAFSTLLATLFLGIGAGAIWQVIVEVGRLLKRDAEKDGLPLISWLNLGALLAGIAVMYLTAFLVK